MSLYGSYECIAKLQFQNDKLEGAEQKQTEVAKVHSHLHNFLISVQIKYFFQNFMQGFKNSWVIWRLKNVVARITTFCRTPSCKQTLSASVQGPGHHHLHLQILIYIWKLKCYICQTIEQRI